MRRVVLTLAVFLPNAVLDPSLSAVARRSPASVRPAPREERRTFRSRWKSLRVSWMPRHESNLRPGSNRREPSAALAEASSHPIMGGRALSPRTKGMPDRPGWAASSTRKCQGGSECEGILSNVILVGDRRGFQHPPRGQGPLPLRLPRWLREREGRPLRAVQFHPSRSLSPHSRPLLASSPSLSMDWGGFRFSLISAMRLTMNWSTRR